MLLQPRMDVSSYQDWRFGKQPQGGQRSLYMLAHNIGCDVTFLVGSKGDKLDAHRFMLIQNSAVFERMLCGDYLEKRQNEIRIDDVRTDTFQMFLRTLYSCSIPADLSVDDAFYLLYTAKKYCVEWLIVHIIEDYLNPRSKKERDPSEACVTLEKTHQFSLFDDDRASKNIVMKYIQQQGDEVLKSSGFKKLCRECVADVIRSDDLRADEEIVYSEVKTWAEEECRRQGLSLSDENKRTVLGNLVYLIRFPAMKRKCFAEIISRDNILTDTEKIEIFRLLTDAGSLQQYRGSFSVTPRRPIPA